MGTPGTAAHTPRPHYCRCRSSSLLLGHEEGTRAGTSSSTSGEGERKQIWKNERRDRSLGHCYAAQWALWPRTGYPPSPARRILASDRQSSGKSQRKTPTGMAKTPERRAGKIYRCDNPLGRRAPGLVRKGSALALTLPDPFGTEPFSCEHRVRDRDNWHRFWLKSQRQRQTECFGTYWYSVSSPVPLCSVQTALCHFA